MKNFEKCHDVQKNEPSKYLNGGFLEFSIFNYDFSV